MLPAWSEFGRWVVIATAPQRERDDTNDTSVSCTHCGLPVPKGLIEPESDAQFCCAGCKTVYGIIHGSGLDRYYGLRRSLERERKRAPEASGDYAAFDDPAFTERYAHDDDTSGLRCATLSLDGVHCAACVWLIERLDRVVPGVVDAKADFARSSVNVRWDPMTCRFSEVALGLHGLGYPPSPPRARSEDERRRLDARKQLIRIGVAGAIAGNVMLVSVALYAGVFQDMDAFYLRLFRLVSAGLGVLALVWPGRVFFAGAIAALRTRTPHLDLPIALALLVGGVWGVANALRGTGEVYFDSLTSLVFLLLVGRFVQSQQQRKAADALDLLLTLTPSVVRVVTDGGTQSRPVEAVSVGDVVEVHAGETVPVDGAIVEGRTELDHAILTGESEPVSAGVDDAVWAGAVNLSSTIRARVSAVGEATRAAKLMKLVAEAAATKAPIVQLADRAAGWFVVIVAALAVVTGVLWWEHGADVALEHATALLIVTCPCALGLATPLVLSATIGRLARSGVLVKGGAPIERLARPGLMLLDKTGTLTNGTMSVAGWTIDEPLRRVVRGLERGATHPIARAIAESGEAATVESVEHRRGLGVTGLADNQRVAVGSPAFLHELGVEVGNTVAAWARTAAEAGLTPVLVAVEGEAVGGVALHDAVRVDAPALLDGLRARGWRLGVLSGDDQRVVSRVAAELGIDAKCARGRITPEGKLDAVREAKTHAGGRETVAMMGDGVNDAAALAAADVGIAVLGSADASFDAADVAIQRGGLDEVARLVEVSCSAMRRVRVCLLASLSYNTVAAGLSMAGLVHPLLAAVLMPLSSITVVAIAASGGKGASSCR